MTDLLHPQEADRLLGPDTEPAVPPRRRHILLWTIAAVFLLPAVVTLILAVVPPPLTPLMVIRGGDSDMQWRPMTRISPSLSRAVIAAEDATFCRHWGFDFGALEEAWRLYRKNVPRPRGGSTITQQTAKNLFLWPDRTLVRKALEIWLTPYLEAIWSKRRIMEVYLNIVEWAPGVYGAEAAARHHFGKSADALTAHEAALLAAVLPNPRSWSAGRPGPYVSGRADTLQARAAGLGPSASCVM